MAMQQAEPTPESAQHDDAITYFARRNVRPEPSYIEAPGMKLPPAGANRWWPHRKAAVVLAVRDGILSLDEACNRYALSLEEFLTWKHAIDLFGLSGLRQDRVQQRRRDNAPSTSPSTP